MVLFILYLDTARNLEKFDVAEWIEQRIQPLRSGAISVNSIRYILGLLLLILHQ